MVKGQLIIICLYYLFQCVLRDVLVQSQLFIYRYMYMNIVGEHYWQTL